MCAQKLSAHRCYWGPFTIFLSKNYQREYQSKKISNMQVWEMAMNFTDLQMFSLPPLSFSDFRLLFVLLVLRKGFIVEIFAIHSGALLILAVCSFPPQVVPVHVHHTTLQLTSSSVIPCEMWVCGNSLFHTCYHGESLYMWGIAYSTRKQDKIWTPEKSWARGLDAERRRRWVQEMYLYDGTFLSSLHVNYCSLGNKNPQGASFVPGTWRCWDAALNRLEGETWSWGLELHGIFEPISGWMNECMVVIPPHSKHYNGEGLKMSPSSPLKPQFLPGQMITLLLLHCPVITVLPPALPTGVGILCAHSQEFVRL